MRESPLSVTIPAAVSTPGPAARKGGRESSISLISARSSDRLTDLGWVKWPYQSSRPLPPEPLAQPGSWSSDSGNSTLSGPHEPAGSIVDRSGFDRREVKPLRGGRLVIESHHRVARSQRAEPDVVVQVRIFARRVDAVHVDVDRRLDQVESGNPGLLQTLSCRHGGQVGLAVGVAACLHPDAEFGVVKQQESTIDRVNNQATAGEMARPAPTVEYIITAGDCSQDRVSVAARIPL